MRITVGQLRQIIKEEVSFARRKRLQEDVPAPPPEAPSAHVHKHAEKDQELYGAANAAIDLFKRSGVSIEELSKQSYGGWGLGDNTRNVLKTFSGFKGRKHAELQDAAMPFLEALVDVAGGTILDSVQKKALESAGIKDLLKGFAKEDRPYGR